MTSLNMGRRYIEEARGRTELVRLAHTRQRWSTVVREAQECVELFLKGDVAALLRQEAARFPEWLQAESEHLAGISSEMAGDRGLAFYGDERQGLGPQELFDEKDAARAVDQLDYVARLAERLLEESP